MPISDVWWTWTVGCWMGGVRRFFLRATVDPEGDIRRGFSGVYNAWVDREEQIPEAIEETYPDGANHLLPPRRDPATGWWCWFSRISPY